VSGYRCQAVSFSCLTPQASHPKPHASYLIQQMPQETLNRQNILITGGTSGLGLELVRLFLKDGFNVVATGRKSLKIPGYEDKFELFRIDFSDLNQVALIMKKICEKYRFDYVINNAGILSPPGFTRTINNFEYTFQVNFLSHLLINEIILSRVSDSGTTKIANVISPVYKLADPKLTIMSEDTGYSALKAYSSSKLYMALMCRFLQVRYPGIRHQCFSFDPGTFRSDIYRMQKKWFRDLYHIASPFMRNPAKVAKILQEILIQKEIKEGMVYNIKRRSGSVPEFDKHEKEVFMKACHNIIDSFMK